MTLDSLCDLLDEGACSRGWPTSDSWRTNQKRGCFVSALLRPRASRAKGDIRQGDFARSRGRQGKQPRASNWKACAYRHTLTLLARTSHLIYTSTHARSHHVQTETHDHTSVQTRRHDSIRIFFSSSNAICEMFCNLLFHLLLFFYYYYLFFFGHDKQLNSRLMYEMRERRKGISAFLLKRQINKDSPEASYSPPTTELKRSQKF